MPSEKDYDGMAIVNRNKQLCDTDMIKIIDAYLSMKSERDKYKAIVESDNELVDKLYEVRSEPDKLLIMVTNKHYAIHRPL